MTQALQKWRQRNEAEIAAEREFCFRMRIAGRESLREIAAAASQHFGYYLSQDTVRNRLQVESAARVEPLAAELKQLSISRAEAQVARLYDMLLDPTVRRKAETKLLVEDRLARAEDRLAKLNGTYAAVSVDVSVAHTGSIDDELQALSDRLGLGNGQVGVKHGSD